MFCPYPFSRCEIKADGNVYCCCEGWLPKPLGNVLNDNLITIWRGPAAIEIRESIVDNSFRHCTACPFLPGPGGPLTVEPTKTLSFERIGTLKLDYDQSCNLACPSCRIVHSDKFVNRNEIRKIHEIVLASGALNCTDQLYITGAGDPFASELYWHFLCNLPDLSYNPTLTVFLHTNGLLLDTEHWKELGPNSDRVTHIGISIDAATPKTYALNRGASWDRLMNNLTFITDLRTRNRRSLMLGLFFVVQANNFQEMSKFVQFGLSYDVNWIAFSALRNRRTYSNTEYLNRAVHLTSHPQYTQFQKTLKNPYLKNPIVVMETFNPSYTNQYIACNPNS